MDIKMEGMWDENIALVDSSMLAVTQVPKYLPDLTALEDLVKVWVRQPKVHRALPSPCLQGKQSYWSERVRGLGNKLTLSWQAAETENVLTLRHKGHTFSIYEV